MPRPSLSLIDFPCMVVVTGRRQPTREYDRLFKWFLDPNIVDRSFDHSVFAKNKQRLLDADVAWEFLLEIVEQAWEQRLLPEEHCSPTF